MLEVRGSMEILWQAESQQKLQQLRNLFDLPGQIQIENKKPVENKGKDILTPFLKVFTLKTCHGNYFVSEMCMEIFSRAKSISFIKNPESVFLNDHLLVL